MGNLIDHPGATTGDKTFMIVVIVFIGVGVVGCVIGIVCRVSRVAVILGANNPVGFQEAYPGAAAQTPHFNQVNGTAEAPGYPMQAENPATTGGNQYV